MAIYRKALMLMTFAGLLWVPGMAFAQETTTPTKHVPLEKTIGAASTKVQVEPSSSRWKNDALGSMGRAAQKAKNPTAISTSITPRGMS